MKIKLAKVELLEKLGQKYKSKKDNIDLQESSKPIRRVKQHEKNKEQNEEDYVEKEGFKKWKRKGSRFRFSDFFGNFFLNKRKIKFNYYVLLTFMIILATGSIFLSVKSYNNLNNEDYINYAAVSAFGKKSDLDENKYLENEHIKPFEDIEEKVINVISTNVVVEEKLEFIKPVNGQIQKLYSPDKVIYSKTLDMWKVHDGVDLKAELGEDVIAIEKGTVEKIYDDSFFGKTVVISHIQGYKSCYSNLSEDIKVEVGQQIKKGQVLGKVGQSAIGEIKDEPHIHFMVYKDEQLIDPMNIF